MTRSRSVLAALTDDELNVISGSLRKFSINKGHTLFKMGQFPRVLYCVSKGKLKITQEGEDGREQIIHLAKPGDVMGYRAIISDDKYSCSAISMEESEICCIPKQIFLETIRQNKDLSFQLLRLFSSELKEAENNITRIVQRPVRERIAHSLILLKEKYGYEDDNVTINLKITREDIANLTGTTRETTIRTLSELDHEKIILMKTRKIAILDYNLLLHVANISI